MCVLSELLFVFLLFPFKVYSYMVRTKLSYSIRVIKPSNHKVGFVGTGKMRMRRLYM